ncbi:hypothetical protein MF672_021555 [Actinomadura sp. ATCC 31491]|uniref:Uncharacterized protein n=1 Tax=Actinomadura luzonensis TaxID=2805427 RepID=A0ABT0FVK0_9ACTN|nr:hypothetical protein [Actinomadura luzonensis]MCK2216366.1 hypothetical protein [Actinomadura luzonensis]
MSIAVMRLDQSILDLALQLADLEWNVEEVDTFFHTKGVEWGSTDPLSKRLFEDLDGRIRLGDRTIYAVPDPDSGRILSFHIPSALCYLADNDPTDPDFRFFRELREAESGWQVDMTGDGEEYSQAWRDGRWLVQKTLGPPAKLGVHGIGGWLHAVWRRGERLIAVIQTESFATYIPLKQVALWVVDFSSDQPIPSGDELYEVITKNA